MTTYKDIFSRTALAAGDEMMERLRRCSVIVFGVGGVGSWCAEALVRSGVGHVTIVDSDIIDISNVNRQLQATTLTVGQPKVDVLRERLLSINPGADIMAIRRIYDSTTAESFATGSYDFAIDAIDSLENKADLILRCTDPATAPREGFFSSMGAALKLDPSEIATTEFWKVRGCPLARALRTKFKRSGRFPRRKFTCVYSPEHLANRLKAQLPAEASESDTWTVRKATVNGTFAHTTAIFGLTLGGLVIRKIYGETNTAEPSCPEMC